MCIMENRIMQSSNKLKVASILWKEAKDSKNEKKYSRELLDKYSRKVKEYRK